MAQVATTTKARSKTPVKPSADVTAVLGELEAFGTEQTRKTYARHGVKTPMYGVSYANLGTLRKRIKVDHALALQLWQSGIHDGRVLATMVADPAQVDEAMARAWAGDLRDYVEADAYVMLLGRTSLARPLAEEWTQDDDEILGRMGYHLLGQLATNDETLPDSYFEPYLRMIEGEIHGAKNRRRQAMNNALIAIGARNDVLEKKAIAVAGRIGKVDIDHGDTSCKTPDAAAYIRKTREHRRKKSSRAA